jgi:hypothetical protein
MARPTLDPDRRFAAIHPRRPIWIGPEFRQKTGTGGRGKAVILWDFRAVCLNSPKVRRVAKPDSTPRTDAAPAPPAIDDRKPRIVTTRRRGKRFDDLYDMTDEEVRRRGDAADELFRELVRRSTKKDQQAP